MSVVPIVVPTGTNEANNIVVEKFNTVTEKADATLATALTAIATIAGLVEQWREIDSSVRLVKPTLDPPVDMESLMKEAPGNPLTEADYEAVEAAIPKSTIFTYSEDSPLSYATLLSRLETNLTTILTTGGSGLGAATENAMFQRETERDEIARDDEIAAHEATWAKRRMPRPGLGFTGGTSRIHTTFMNARLDKSRKITEESRKYEIETLRHALTESRGLISILAQMKDKYWDRKLEAAKQTVTVALAILSATIDSIKAKAAVFEAEMNGFTAYVTALARLNEIQISIVKAQADLAIADANVQLQNVANELKEQEVKMSLSDSANKAVAQLLAQLVASMWSAVSAAAHISAGVSTSVGSNISVSESYPHKET